MAAAILVNLHGVHLPVGLGEVAGVVGDIVFTSRGFGGAGGVGGPDGTSPVTAEGGVEDLRENKVS